MCWLLHCTAFDCTALYCYRLQCTLQSLAVLLTSVL